MKNNFYKNICITSLLALVLILAGCKKYIEPGEPKNSLERTKVFTDPATAESAVLGMYSNLNDSYYGFVAKLSYVGGLLADELKYSYSGTDNNIIEKNALLPTTTDIFWRKIYLIVYQANDIINLLPGSTNIPDAKKNQLMGEAKFVRALCYFYLVNYYGDVPYVTSTDVVKTSVLPRTPAAEVYKAIINDLTEAKNLLPQDYPTTGRSRPIALVANAMLARVYLYTKDWPNAEAQALTVISSTKFSLVSNLNAVFLSTSTEAIWQLWTADDYTNDGSVFVPPFYAPTQFSFKLTNNLVNAFEPGDLRFAAWTNGNSTSGYGPYKYKARSDGSAEYYMMFRLAEQYLIRAEAMAQQNKIPDAVGDLNVIRARAGLITPVSNTISQAALLDTIAHENRIEFFAELTHRWFDLKRTDKATIVLGALKPTWKPTAVLLPVPFTERQLNPALTQNPGYD